MTPSLQPLLNPEVAGAVGAWMGTYLVHSTALFALAWTGARALRSVAVREQLWRAALIGPLVTASLQVGAGFDPLGGTWRMPEPAAAETKEAPVTAAPIRVQLADEARARYAAARASSDARARRAPAPAAPSQGSGLDLAASLLLAAGIASLTWRAALEAARVARLGRRTRLDDPGLESTFEALKERAGIRRRVRLERTAGGLSPYATGVLFPRVVVPDTVRTSLDPRGTKAMLAHELGHVARGDAAWSAVARTLGALLFFQPLNRIVLARLDENAEFACDAFAVRLTGDEVGLANCLTQVAEWILGAPQAVAPACPMAHKRSKLGERVEHILGVDHAQSPRRFRGLSASIVALTAVAAPAVAAHADADSPGARLPSTPAPAATAAPLRDVFEALGREALALSQAAEALRAGAAGRPSAIARIDAFVARAERITELSSRVARTLR